MDAVPFPRDIDAPQRFLFWTFDQMVPFSTLVVVGLMMEMLFVSIILGAALSWAFARYRDSKPDGFLQHAAYWYGLLPLKGRAVLNPFQRRIYPQ